MMKTFKYYFGLLLLSAFLFSGCQDDEASFGEIIAPTNVQISLRYLDNGTESPAPGLGSGTVEVTATADNVTAFQFVYAGSTVSAPGGRFTYDFAVLGLNTYTINVVAYGTGGASTSQTFSFEVLSLYEPPADLLEMLHGDSSKTWRIKAEQAGHFGLGPPDGTIPGEWFSAPEFDKAGVGMYDDRYVFDTDGTFTHITNNDNDDSGVDPSGTIFGRDGLVEELNGPGGNPDGADIENYPYDDYSENWSLSAPGGVETISLSGLGFIGYYTGGDHKYDIFSRSSNEMILRTTDGNGEFDWWLTLTSLEGEEPPGFQSQYTTLVWADEFDTDGAPDPANWTYDLQDGCQIDPNLCGWGNGEQQWYTDDPSNVIVEDGVLKITARKETTGTREYSSTRLKSEGLFEFTYGRVEISAKLPSAQGTWPALWLLGTDCDVDPWPACGEMDIMEQTGQDKDNISGTLHYPAVSPGTGNTAVTSISNASTEFHTYSIEWTPDTIYILLDGEVFHTVNDTAELPFDNDFYMILNIAMGGSLGGIIDPAFTEDTMEIDYVRVFQ